MPEENLYELLQVEPSADLPEIRAAYRRLVLQYHPDRNPDADAQEMTQRLNQAYGILSNPASKAAYDRRLSGEPWEPPPAEGQQNTGAPSTSSSRAGFFRGLPRSAWLAGTAAVGVAVVVVVIVSLAGGGDSNNGGQSVQVVAPVATPDITPPSPADPAGGSTAAAPTAPSKPCLPLQKW